MVQLLEGRIVESAHFAFIDLCAVAEYLLIMEDYLTTHLLPYMSDEDTCNNPTTLKGIELLYVAGYQSLAKHLYILACMQPYHATDYADLLRALSGFVSRDGLGTSHQAPC